MTRKIKNNAYRTKPNDEAAKMLVAKNIPGGLIDYREEELNGEYRRAKRYKMIGGNRRAAGLSENYIKVYKLNTLY